MNRDANDIWERANPFLGLGSGSVNLCLRLWVQVVRFKIRYSSRRPSFQNTNMTHPDQWSAQARDAPRPDVLYDKQPLPGAAPIQQDERYIDSGTPFDSGRFKPKMRMNDPIFLVIFVAQVLYCAVRFRRFVISRAGA